jgi:hypothetical protein
VNGFWGSGAGRSWRPSCPTLDCPRESHCDPVAVWSRIDRLQSIVAMAGGVGNGETIG